MGSARVTVAALLLCAGAARADDTNYQNYVVGQRALGMGGAFTALADDGAGAYYNPAGIAMSPETTLSASLSVYGVERRALRGAVGPPVDVQAARPDLVSSNVPTIPTTVGFAYKFGRRYGDGIKRFGISYSVFEPYHSSFDFAGSTQIFPAPPDDFDVEIHERDKTVQQGPSFAMRITPRLSMGLAAFHVYRDTSWSSTVRQVSERDSDLLAEYFDEQRASITRSVHSLLLRAGARFDLTERWKLGLALTAPSITLVGSGTAHTSSTTHEAGCVSPPRCVRYEDFGGDVDADSRTPLSVRAGVAYTIEDRLTVALDLSYNAPLTYDPFDVGNDSAKFGETGPVVLSDLRREQVFNANVGGELLLSNVTLRAGFFTNFSSAPEVERAAFATAPRIHMLGATLSAGYRWKSRTISLGVLYSFGSGHASALTPQDPAATLNQPYGPVEERRDYVYFFISGAQEALKDTAVDWIKRKTRGKPAEPAQKKTPASQPASQPARGRE